MKVTLIGIGGGRNTLSLQAYERLKQAELIIGAQRMLSALPEDCAPEARRVSAYLPEKILQVLYEMTANRACVLFSGDTGFYSGASKLLPLLKEAGYDCEILPGTSSLQHLSAALGRPWQDWRLVSAHGRDCDPVWEVMQRSPVLFLTGGAEGVHNLCGRLTEAGLGNLAITVGENLASELQRVYQSTALALTTAPVAELNVLLIEPAPVYPAAAPGIPDEQFIRGKVPMTKQEMRCVILGKLAVKPEDCCWDIGAGTGAVSVELSRHARSVWAVEQKAEACELIRANRERFCAWNLHVIAGEATACLANLPNPDVVFIGGSGGHMAELVEAACSRNPEVRICISAIALESLQMAMNALKQQGRIPQVTQISVSRSNPVGNLSLLMAQNPVFLITGEKS